MNRLPIHHLLLTALLLSPPALAAAPLSLSVLVGRTPVTPALEAARSNSATAQQVYTQLRADPVTLKADLLAAQGDASFANLSLGQAVRQERLNTAQAFVGVLAAGQKLRYDQLRLETARTELNVARQRVQVGSGTAALVEQAQVAALLAEQDVTLDTAQRTVRQAVLGGVLGLTQVPELSDQVPASAGALPALAEVRRNVGNVPLVQRAANTVAVSALRYKQTQTDYTPPVQRNSALQVLTAAQLDYQSQLSAAQQNAEAAFVAALSARAQLSAARATLAAQERAFQTALTQEKAGTVSRLQVAALNVTVAQAQLALAAAEQQVYLTGLALRLAAPPAGQP